MTEPNQQTDDQLWQQAISDDPPPENDPKPAAPEAQAEQDEIANRVAKIREIGGRLGTEMQARKAAEEKAARLEAELQAMRSGKQPGQELPKFAKLKEEASDWAEGVEELVNARLSQVQPPPKQEQLSATELETLRVEKYHKGWVDIVNSPDFAVWLEKQPAEVKELATSPLGDDVVELLDGFMSHVGKPRELSLAEKRRRQLNVAASMPTRSATSAGLPVNESDLSEDELWEQAKRRVYGK